MRDSVLPGRGAILATVLSMSRIKEISIFVDESGTFVAQSDRNVSRYYILGMVLHDQAEDISTEVHSLEDSLSAQGLPRNHCVHAGPLIRREHEYAHLQREERRGIFQRMLAFVRKSNISYRRPNLFPGCHRRITDCFRWRIWPVRSNLSNANLKTMAG